VDGVGHGGAAMSLTTVKSYFKTRCLAVPGFREHKDAFNWRNIASSGLNKAFHITIGQTTARKIHQPNCIESETDVAVRLFFKGYRDPAAGIDTAIQESELLIKSCAAVAQSHGTSIKNVTFNSMQVEPFDESNDNSIISTLNFTALVLTDVEGA
jgi:hypothetical protein